MTTRRVQAERLFDRPWRPGHPFRPRLSARRRWGMLIVLLVFWTIIGGYWYLTDSDRVRRMAETYLSKVLGGPVEVGAARLSIFEGLRLERVTVRVDDSPADDSVIFTAASFIVKYNPRAILTGRIDAAQIIAIDPHVHLSENLDNGTWNYQRLVRDQTSNSLASGQADSLTPPEILLRNAQFDYAEIRNGRRIPRGSMAIEGRLWPGSERGRYNFELQSRGESEGIGPAVSGSVALASGQVNLRLARFRFDADMRSLLPAQVRRWWEDHQLQGRLDIPELTFNPGRGSGRSTFRVETSLDGVTLSIRPEEWTSRQQNQRVHEIRGALRLMDNVGFNNAGALDPFNTLFDTSPILVEHAAGTFVFTQDGIEIERLSGRVETNAFQISGHIDGYWPDAAATLQLRTPASEALYIPHAPRYVNSLPPDVREIYDRFRPEGTCRIDLQLTRRAAGAPVRVTGRVDVLDANFCIDEFRYPMRHARGQIVLGVDPVSGLDRLELRDMHARGPADGPNANCDIRAGAVVSPLGPTSGFDIHVEGQDIYSEPALCNAMPREARQALMMFDPHHAGGYPDFHGGFTCHLVRPIGRYSDWTFNTQIHLDDASGALAEFPYPLRHLQADMTVHNDGLEITEARMRHGEATLAVTGQVRWGDHKPVAPDLRITARNVPIDGDLLSALPPETRQWIAQLGLGGKVDVEGTLRGAFRPSNAAPIGGVALAADRMAQPSLAQVSSAAPDGPALPSEGTGDAIDYDLSLHLHDGCMWPVDGTFALSDLSADMQLNPRRLLVRGLTAHRGQADVAASGTLGWSDGRPSASLSVKLTNVVLDAALRAILPGAAQQGWDAVDPQGTVDADVTYAGPLGGTRPAGATAASSSDITSAASDAATTQPVSALTAAASATPSAFEVIIRPRSLSVTPRTVPYRLDDVSGTIVVAPGRVALEDITARHGPALIALSGTGNTGPDAAWDLKLSARALRIDDDLRRALPDSIRSSMDTMKLSGIVSVDFTKLLYADRRSSAPPPATQPGTDHPVPVAALVDVPAAATGLALVAATDTGPAEPLTPGSEAPSPASGPSAATTQPEARPDIDFAAHVSFDDAQLDLGVPVSDLHGAADTSGTVRAGRLVTLDATADLPALRLAGRDVHDLKFDLFKPGGKPALHIGNVRATLAGGEFGGQFDMAFPDNAAPVFSMSLLLRNAAVAPLVGNADENLKGQATASLALDGTWGDPKSRRGRGEVSASGRNMYRVPVLLGLLEITNLSLPISSPFREASAIYSVQGPVVAFERIELRSDNMLMQGSGSLNFATRKVDMTFTSNNPLWPKLPFIGDLIQGARNELLQIRVRGTIQEPKVSANPMSTFQTTIDEVFRDEPQK